MQFTRLILLPIATLLTVTASLVAFPLEMAWFYVFGSVGLVFCLTSWLLPLVYLKKVPPVARELMECQAKKQVPAIICHDSGRSYLVRIEERMAEGVVITSQGKYKLLPQSIDITEALEEKTDPKEKKQQASTNDEDKKKSRLGFDIYGWISHRSILAGLGLPFYLGYSGILCLLNPECMALYQAGELFVPTEQHPTPTKEDLDKDGKVKPKPLMWLDPTKLKNIINKRFSTSQIDAILIDVDRRARLGRGLGTGAKIAIFILIAVIAVALIFFLMSGGVKT